MGFRVAIKHTHTGTIDTKFFAFADYLSGRSKDRQPGMPHAYTGPFEVRQCNGEFGWYIAIPKDLSQIRGPLEKYIDLFE